MHRRLVLTAVAVVAAGTVASGTATAASKAKPFTKTYTQTDATPDPTGGAIAGNDICNGKIPQQEAPVPVNIPAPGKLKASLSNFSGDWAIAIRTSNGAFLTGDDENPPDAMEAVSAKIKKAGKYLVQACNLGGTPMADVKLVYTPT